MSANASIVQQLDALLGNSCSSSHVAPTRAATTTTSAGEAVSTLTAAASAFAARDDSDGGLDPESPHRPPYQRRLVQTPVSASHDSFRRPSSATTAAAAHRTTATSFDQWRAAHPGTGRPTADNPSTSGQGRVGRPSSAAAAAVTKEEEDARWAGFLARVQRQEKEKERCVALVQLERRRGGSSFVHTLRLLAASTTVPGASWSGRRRPWRRRSASSRPASQSRCFDVTVHHFVTLILLPILTVSRPLRTCVSSPE